MAFLWCKIQVVWDVFVCVFGQVLSVVMFLKKGKKTLLKLDKCLFDCPSRPTASN